MKNSLLLACLWAFYPASATAVLEPWEGTAGFCAKSLFALFCFNLERIPPTRFIFEDTHRMALVPLPLLLKGDEPWGVMLGYGMGWNGMEWDYDGA